MADKINQFPRGAFSLPAGIKTQLRNPTTASGTGYFVTDALSIDFRVQGILENSSDPVLSKGYQVYHQRYCSDSFCHL